MNEACSFCRYASEELLKKYILEVKLVREIEFQSAVKWNEYYHFFFNQKPENNNNNNISLIINRFNFNIERDTNPKKLNKGKYYFSEESDRWKNNYLFPPPKI